MLRKARYILLLAAVLSLFLMVVSCQSSGSNTGQTDTISPSGLDLAAIPLEQALSSGLPTLAEFGWRTCIPCKEMKPILEELAVEYQGKLNVVIVEVYEHEDQTRQYEIMTIPTQILFDSKGKEVIRHVGLWAKKDIITQLKKMGVN